MENKSARIFLMQDSFRQKNSAAVFRLRRWGVEKLLSTHDSNFISVLVHIIQSSTLIIAAVLHIPETGYLDLTRAVGASGSRLRFGRGICGRLLIGGWLLILGLAFLLRHI